MAPPRQYVVYASKLDVVVKMRKTAGRHTVQQSAVASHTGAPAPLFGGSEVLRAAEREFSTPSSTLLSVSSGIGITTFDNAKSAPSQQSFSPLSVQGRVPLGALSLPLALGIGTETPFRATTPFCYSLGDGFSIGVAPPVFRCKRHRHGAKARRSRAHSHNAARPTGAAAAARRVAARAFGVKNFGRHEFDSKDVASAWREGDGEFVMRNETYTFTSSTFKRPAFPVNLKRAPVAPATRAPSALFVLSGGAPNGSVRNAPGMRGGSHVFGYESTGKGGFQIGAAPPVHMKGRRILKARSKK